MHDDIWKIQEMRANPGAIIRAAKRRKRPQVITVRGKKEALVMPYTDNDSAKPVPKKNGAGKHKKKKTLGNFLRTMPKLGLSNDEVESLFSRHPMPPVNKNGKFNTLLDVMKTFPKGVNLAELIGERSTIARTTDATLFD